MQGVQGPVWILRLPHDAVDSDASTCACAAISKSALSLAWPRTRSAIPRREHHAAL